MTGNKITKVYFVDGRIVDIPDEFTSYRIDGNALTITFKRGYSDNARYFFPLDNIRCIAYDEKEILARMKFTEGEEIMEVVDRITELED